MKPCWMILALCILFCFAPACPAQEASPAKSADQKATDYGSTSQLDTIVVTASKLPQTKGNVTQKVDIISEKRLNEIVLENRNIAEALQYEPGIFVNVLSRKDANWGSYGGLGTKYNTYLLDGLPIDSFVDPMALDPVGAGQDRDPKRAGISPLPQLPVPGFRGESESPGRNDQFHFEGKNLRIPDPWLR